MHDIYLQRFAMLMLLFLPACTCDTYMKYMYLCSVCTTDLDIYIFTQILLWHYCQYIRIDLPIEVLGNVFSVIASWFVKMYISTLPQQMIVNRATNVCNDIL